MRKPEALIGVFVKQLNAALADENAALIAEIERLKADNNTLRLAVSSALLPEELKLVDKNCDWVAFGHAFRAVMKKRLAALNP